MRCKTDPCMRGLSTSSTLIGSRSPYESHLGSVADQQPEGPDEAHSCLRGRPTIQPLGIAEYQRLDNDDPPWLNSGQVPSIRHAIGDIGSGGQTDETFASHLNPSDGFLTSHPAPLRKTPITTNSGSRFKRSSSPLSRSSPPRKRTKFVFPSYFRHQNIRDLLQSQPTSRSLRCACRS